MTEADIDDLLADIEQQVLQVGYFVAFTSTAYAQHAATILAASWQLLLPFAAAETQQLAVHAIISCCKDLLDHIPDAHPFCLQDIQQELAALEHSEQQDQQRAVAMAEEHLHFLQSASESTTAAELQRQQRHGSGTRMQRAQQLQLLSQWIRLHTAANRRCTAVTLQLSGGTCRRAGLLRHRAQDPTLLSGRSRQGRNI
jgi:hypothetical protein